MSSALRAYLELAQDVVERRLEICLRVTASDDQRAADLEGAGGKRLRPRSRDDDRVRRDVAAILDRLWPGDVDHRYGTGERHVRREHRALTDQHALREDAARTDEGAVLDDHRTRL